MSITRRLFLGRAAVIGTAVTAVPVAASEPETTPHELAIWHVRELERLVREDGGWDIAVMAIAKYANHQDCRMISVRPSGRLTCDDNMFAPKGGAK